MIGAQQAVAGILAGRIDGQIRKEVIIIAELLQLCLGVLVAWSKSRCAVGDGIAPAQNWLDQQAGQLTTRLDQFDEYALTLLQRKNDES